MLGKLVKPHFGCYANLAKQKGAAMAALREWMDKTDIDVYEAARAFGVSIYAVKK